jgi:hypothetical protein
MQDPDARGSHGPAAVGFREDELGIANRPHTPPASRLAIELMTSTGLAIAWVKSVLGRTSG